METVLVTATFTRQTRLHDGGSHVCPRASQMLQHLFQGYTLNIIFQVPRAFMLLTIQSGGEDR